MLVIGLTGGIGTGKTEVSKILSGFGAPLVYADELAHQTYIYGTQTWSKIVSEFGHQILRANGDIDRSKLREIVFSDGLALNKLNSLVHPEVQKLITNLIQQHSEGGTEVLVIEIPLLVEAIIRDEAWTSLINEIWITDSPPEMVVERLRKRNNISMEMINETIRAQTSQSERKKYADVIIDNSGNLNDLEHTVSQIWNQHIALKNKREDV